MLIRAVVLFAVVALASGAESMGKNPPKPEKFKGAQGCYIEHLDRVIPYGSYSPVDGNCMRYLCGEEWISYQTCGKAVATPPLVLVEDKTKPYPDCCPKIRAPKA